MADRGPVKAVGPFNNRGQVVVTKDDGVSYLRTGSNLQPITDQGQPISVVAMNDSGVVVGWAPTATKNVAVRWERGTATVLDNPPGVEDFAAPVDINARGQILLQFLHFDVTDLRGWGLLWDGGRLTQIGPGDGDFSTVTDLNNAGQVTGGVRLTNGQTQVFRWDRVRGFTLLGNPPDQSGGFPFAINDAGQLVGRGAGSTGAARAFRWQNGQYIGLGTLGGTTADPVESPRALNAAGTIVGLSATAGDQSQQPFAWANGRMKALGAPPKASVLGINDRGLVVGANTATDGSTQGWAWWNGRVTSLPSLGGTVVNPTGFNNDNAIVGTSTAADGTTHAVEWKIS